MLRRSWVEIKTDTIVENYRIFKSHLPEWQQIMAVVKADAYGHGEMRVARALKDVGCVNFAVSNIEEAASLREAGITGQVLILGYTPVSMKEELKRLDITQALLNEEYAELMSGCGIKAQFAIDTGMNRIGLDADVPSECERIIRKYQSGFGLTGLFTHLCVADTDSERDFTEGQIAKFRTVAESVSDLSLPYIHCMNSAGGLRYQPYGNLVRLGIILYGLKPDISNTLLPGIKPALEWKSVISEINWLKEGETVGYGRTFRADRPMKIAVIPTGYADGLDRMLSNRGCVFIHGKKAPIIGRICMDQMTVDVSDIPQASFEDEVTLIGSGYTADDMATSIGTIGYEVVCGISKRVPKIYI